VTEQLLTQQLESPSGTGRVEPRSETQPVSYRHQRAGCSSADPFSLAVLARSVPGGRWFATWAASTLRRWRAEPFAERRTSRE
jgi:hypothetical protein